MLLVPTGILIVLVLAAITIDAAVGSRKAAGVAGGHGLDRAELSVGAATRAQGVACDAPRDSVQPRCDLRASIPIAPATVHDHEHLMRRILDRGLGDTEAP